MDDDVITHAPIVIADDEGVYTGILRAHMTLTSRDKVVVEDPMSVDRIYKIVNTSRIPQQYLMVLDVEGSWRHINTDNIVEVIFENIEDSE